MNMARMGLGVAVSSLALLRYFRSAAQPARLLMTPQVLAQIRNTIGQMYPEHGGMLGGDPKSGLVTHFHFDESAQVTGGTYSPDSRELTRLLKEVWNPAGVRLLGFVHSHPRGCYGLSEGDIRYAAEILRHNQAIDRLLLPIVRPATDGEFGLNPYCVVREPGVGICTARMRLNVIGSVTDEASTASIIGASDIFSRVRNAYDLQRLSRSRVIYVGVGGAAGFAEDMVRAGIGSHVLIDPDIVSYTNLATQQVYGRDVGRPKVEALAERLADINPSASIGIHCKRLEAISDKEFQKMLADPIDGAKPAAILLAGLSDSFSAQARVNALALQFGIPSLCAQLYEEGRGAEVTFTHPATTRACHRCALSSRYRAYLEDVYTNTVTSDGTPIFSTTRLNALKGFIAMAILHYGTSHGRWGRLLERISDRNLIQVRMDPDLPLLAFARTFAHGDAARILFDETVWLPQEPESRANGYPYDCPDCGGSGNLCDSVGSFADTRETRPCCLGGLR